jgi:hypothetical protein
VEGIHCSTRRGGGNETYDGVLLAAFWPGGTEEHSGSGQQMCRTSKLSEKRYLETGKWTRGLRYHKKGWERRARGRTLVWRKRHHGRLPAPVSSSARKLSADGSARPVMVKGWRRNLSSALHDVRNCLTENDAISR